MYIKYDNMHTNGIINALICINNHVNSCINCMLLHICVCVCVCMCVCVCACVCACVRERVNNGKSSFTDLS